MEVRGGWTGWLPAEALTYASTSARRLCKNEPFFAFEHGCRCCLRVDNNLDRTPNKALNPTREVPADY